MVTPLDLTGGEVKVVGNVGDEHLFRLTNPVGQDVIAVGGEYEADFISYLGGPETTPVVLDTTDIANGVLTFTVLITNGTYRVRRTNPRRTLLTIEVVEAK